MEKLASDGMTMICVTHEMGSARRLASRFAAPRSEPLRSFLSQILH
jgi:ABC-type polar amino acid transport system ATPase subunit